MDSSESDAGTLRGVDLLPYSPFSFNGKPQALFLLRLRLAVKRNTVQESGSHPFVVPPSVGICTEYHNRIRLKAGLQANMERYCV